MKNLLPGILLVCIVISNQVTAAYLWQSHTTLSSLSRDRATGFVIGDNLYFGSGYHHSSLAPKSDFWVYNTITETWTQIADIPGIRHGASGFSYNGKGYVCLGHQQAIGYTFYNDMQEYNPVTNTWTFKLQFPASGRYGATAFVLNNKAYVVGGNLGSGAGPFSNEVYAYDFNTDSWIQCANYPGTLSYYRTSFQIGNLGYVGSGVSLTGSLYTFYNEFYSYNPVADSWTSIAPYPGGLYAGMSSVVYQQMAFVGLGTTTAQTPNSAFYIFSPATGSWSMGPAFTPGPLRAHGVGMSTATRAFIGTGLITGNSLDDLWELTETVSLNEAQQNVSSVFIHDGMITVSGNVHPEGRLELFNLAGQSVANAIGTNQLSTSSFSGGVYLVRYSVNSRVVAASKVVIP